MSTALGDLSSGASASALVPGNADAIDQLSQRLLRFSDVFADAAQALSRAEVHWTGPAAQAFHAEFGLQPAAFKKAAVAFSDGGFALGSHALSVESGQHMAQQAIELFQEGMRAARVAMAAAGTPTVPGNAIVDSGLLARPEGEPERQAAAEKLDRARSEVQRSGTAAAATLRVAVSDAPEWTSAWQHLVNVATGLPWAPTQEQRDFAVGGVEGLLDTVVLAASTANPLPMLMWLDVTPQLENLQWQHGIDPRSGWHTAGSIVVPTVLTAGLAVSETAPATVVRPGIREVSHPPIATPGASDLPILAATRDDVPSTGWREVVAETGHGQTRHQAPQTWLRRSQFYDDIDVMNLIERAPDSGALQANGNTHTVAHAPFDVGVDRFDGLPTNTYTVFRRPDGTVASVFPGAIRWS